MGTSFTSCKVCLRIFPLLVTTPKFPKNVGSDKRVFWYCLVSNDVLMKCMWKSEVPLQLVLFSLDLFERTAKQ